jgi:hypothetical protein
MRRHKNCGTLVSIDLIPFLFVEDIRKMKHNTKSNMSKPKTRIANPLNLSKISFSIP